jgi:hypothetical protein
MKNEWRGIVMLKLLNEAVASVFDFRGGEYTQSEGGRRVMSLYERSTELLGTGVNPEEERKQLATYLLELTFEMLNPEGRLASSVWATANLNLLESLGVPNAPALFLALGCYVVGQMINPPDQLICPVSFDDVAMSAGESAIDPARAELIAALVESLLWE